MPGLVGARAGAVLGRHQRAVAQSLRSGDRPQRRDADAGVDRLASRCARAGGFVVALRDGVWLARADGTLDRKVADAPVRSGAPSLQRRPLRPAGPLLRRHDEREARRRTRRRSCASIADCRVTPHPRRHDDQQRPRVESRRPHDVSRRHADACDPRLRLRCGDRHAVVAARVRALGRRDRPARRRAPSTAKATTGSRSIAAARSCSCRRAARSLAEYPVAGDVPDDVRVRRRGSAHAVRDQRAPDARRRRARAPAAIGRHLRDARRRRRACPNRCSPADARTRPDAPRSRRLPSPRASSSLGSTSTGVSFATSTGDMLEVTAYGGGTFRLRVGPNTRPDYGLVVGRAQALHDRATRSRACGRSPPATRRSRSRGAPLRFRLLWKGAPVLTSITDEHFRGWTRLPTFGRAQARRAVDRGVRARIRRAGLRSRRKIRPAQQARAAHPFAGRRRARRQHRALATRTRRSRGARAPAAARGASFVHTPGMVTHGVGHPDWSHRCYAVVVDDEALDLFLFAADTPAGMLDAYTQHHRARAGGAALEPRPVGLARISTRRRRMRSPSRASCASGGFPATC